MDEIDDDRDEPVLELVKTRLLIRDGELRRTNQNGGVLLRLPLHAIQSIELRSSFDPVSLVILGFGAALAAIGYYISENNLLTSVLYVAAVSVAAFGLFAAWGLYIVIRTADGVTRIQCSDLKDEGECFVLSLRQWIER